jgi:hypothetical protein
MMAEAVPMAMNSRRGVARVSTRNKQVVIVPDILFFTRMEKHTTDGVRLVLFLKRFVG